MIDTLFIGMSGMTEYSKGLRVVSNNLTNMNTLGFKSSSLRFRDMYYQGGADAQRQAGWEGTRLGAGLATVSSAINFNAGQTQQTGNALDAAIDGEGLFVFRQDGQTRYGRAGQLALDPNDVLINTATGQRVAGLGADGQLADISVAGLRNNPQKATGTIKLQGNLPLSAASGVSTDDVVLGGVTVMDPMGGTHTLQLTFHYNGPDVPGDWTMTAKDVTAAAEVPLDIGERHVRFDAGAIIATESKLQISYAPTGVKPFDITLDFTGTTSNATVTAARISMASQDGYGAGTLKDVKFDEEGSLVVSYTNGQTAKGLKLALARFDDPRQAVQLDGAQFSAAEDAVVHIGEPGSGQFGKVKSGFLEGSNVDMEEEFGQLIVMQRGYQASAQILTTANEMIQSLLNANKGG